MNNILSFLVTLFCGWFGLHKFLQKKVGIGFLYLFTFGLFGIGWIIDIVLALMKLNKNNNEPSTISSNSEFVTTENVSSVPKTSTSIIELFKINKLKQQIVELENKNTILTEKINRLGAEEFFEIEDKINQLKTELVTQEKIYNESTQEHNELIAKLRAEIINLSESKEKLDKQVTTQSKKLSRIKDLYQSIEYAIDNFINTDISYESCKISQIDRDDCDLLSPSILLKLHCMDMKDLKVAYRENEKLITKLLEQYSSRYTTKANQSIYNLMVIALRAELQNILYNLKYEKLDSSIDAVKNISAKYLKIAGEGNQSIAGTLTKFIGEIEYLFINAVKIEYNYYVKREQAKQEQAAIREQIRQEAAERKALEEERKKIEQEEAKFESQITTLQEQIASAEGSELNALKARILELQSQLANVTIKKEEISKLQNGKAGNVYIISNLGSFGDNIFKIGMTRRLDPQERINELGDASVPFRFDVHSFIFSDDASNLETELHNRLHDRRVNKVNLRKEFFNITIDELEELVTEICPTAEFNKTMLAEEFRQSLSTDEVYSSDYEFEESYTAE